MKVIVSACLLGENCKYNGGNNYCPEVERWVSGKAVLALCPERLAGLGTPRTPIEIREGILVTRDGENVDRALRESVERVVESLEGEEIACAVLQSRSPTCGVNQIYDGTFSGKLIPGSGVFARALQSRGYQVIDAEDIATLLSREESGNPA